MYASYKRNLSKIRPVVFSKLDFEVDGFFSKSGNLFFHGFCIGFSIDNFQSSITKKHRNIQDKYMTLQWKILYKSVKK